LGSYFASKIIILIRKSNTLLHDLYQFLRNRLHIAELVITHG